MTNFSNPKPYIDTKASLPHAHEVDRADAIKEAIEIIRENKRIVDAASKDSHENPHR